MIKKDIPSVVLIDTVPNYDNNCRLLNQAHYFVANYNFVKAEETLRAVGINEDEIKDYIKEEYTLQKKYPSGSGFKKWNNKPMPEELKLKGVS